ncbi:DNA cytosine methyltransferase [Balneolaceae bacterium YR4-1]|uniref:Cytosine-specific methyltransferase n=1 Tax=Halalkalibaculum roseum TaxID=2709311 RepID=A0A6M1SJ37_9BACT|nr:DNA cytosine methyltransferase [Halalkalibaculum roseum]NGP75019.1 DNA cytosine methyltransferase [Halalkalibaculum roseum]
MPVPRLKHVELFAGCGGLSLGLKAAGFDLMLANEKSRMAAETFSYNLLGQDLNHSDKNSSLLIKGQDDVKGFIRNFKNGSPRLHVGDILKLVEFCEIYSSELKKLNIDLVSGGPPCQGFSLAGRRKERDPKNQLPYSFLDFVHLSNPRFVILENVLGITQPFKKDGGVRYPWFELAKAFISQSYVPFCFIVNARDFGIPQNRPRFILFGVRSDQARIFEILKTINPIYKSVHTFAEKLMEVNEEALADLPYTKLHSQNFPLINMTREEVANYGFLIQKPDQEISTKEAIDDLSKESPPSAYVKNLNKRFRPYLNHPEGFSLDDYPYNQEERNHTQRVKKRFSFLQIASKNKIDLDFSKLDEFFSQKESVKKLFKAASEKGLVKRSNGKVPEEILRENFEDLKTKKHSQKALKATEPAPAQLTIPDDYCHYSVKENRVLTVREMARIQSFPDSFVFRSKVTTGGLNRRDEVPQYTQVGNAVPPLLGYGFGEFIKSLTDK